MSKVKSLIKYFEGEKFTAYKDAAGLSTIGIGHLIKPDESYLLTATITPEQSNALFEQDLSIAESAIKQLVSSPLNPQQFAALCSFIFNVGVTSFKNSTMLKKLNAGDYDGAASEFLRWNKAGGEVVPGLVQRRMAEMTLFKQTDNA